jgi:heme-degrading monooxygenase HmoA
MMVVVFRARRTPEGGGPEYRKWFERMSELARNMPGYISHKGYVAEDGERLTLFEWEAAEKLRAWATHPEHVPVQQLGRQKFFTHIACKCASSCANPSSRATVRRIARRFRDVSKASGAKTGIAGAIHSCKPFARLPYLATV